MGIWSTIAGVFNSFGNKKAIKKANAAQQAKINESIGLINNANTNMNMAFSPYEQSGLSANDAYLTLMGLKDGVSQQNALDLLLSSPEYTTPYNQGVKTILQNASATGGLRGGNNQIDLGDFGSRLALDVKQQRLAQLLGLVNTGIGATSQRTNNNMINTNAVTNLLTTSGNATASSILGRQQAGNQGINQLAGYLDANNGSNINNIMSLLSGFKLPTTSTQQTSGGFRTPPYIPTQTPQVSPDQSIYTLLGMG